MSPEKIYEMFKEQAGSDNIAGLATIKPLVTLCKESHPKTILELGGGIGTLSYAFLTNSDATVDIYEHNDFCQEILRKNLKGMESRYTIIPDYLHLPPQREYDLIVVDGGKGRNDYDGGFPQAIGAYLYSLANIKTIFIEGQRKSQKYWILEAIRNRFLYTVTKYDDPLGGKKICVRIDCRPSTGKATELYRLVNHLYWKNKVY